MKPTLIAALSLLLAACTPGTTPAHFAAADKLCEPNGGLAYFWVERAGTEYRQLSVVCKDQTEITKTVPK